jgi:hypothetical protein
VESWVQSGSGLSLRPRWRFQLAQAAQITSQRLYLETMEQVLPRIKKLIVDQNGNLDLTIIRKGEK